MVIPKKPKPSILPGGGRTKSKRMPSRGCLDPKGARELKGHGGVQVRLDHMLLILGNPIRIGVLKFLGRARKNGDPVQSFATIGRALKTINQHVSTANLGYHLSILKKENFILQPDGPSNGYMLSDIGRHVLGLLEKLECMAFDSQFLCPNTLDEYTYVEHVEALLDARNDDNHVTHVDFTPRVKGTPLDTIVGAMDQLETRSRENSSTDRTKKAKFSRLDSFL